jgi:site-specific DNA recombinase
VIAAIYARKSTDQSGLADEQKSVNRQTDHARAYALRKGWTVDDAHVFVDDGISGAEFANRPGFLRLMNALKPQPPFQVLVMSEVSRLGREQIETAYALKQLAVAGVRCFSYLEDRELQMTSATDKFLLGAITFAADLEREKARQRVHDAMARKARAGHVTGGKVFGYDNVPVVDAAGKRSHVERRVNEAEAVIVRRIFDLCAGGTGYTRIAKALNAQGAPAPRPKSGRPVSWAPSSVKEILDRRLYLGEVLWNQTEKRNSWGQVDSRARPEHDWIRASLPNLQIITEQQWRFAHDRLDAVRRRLMDVSGGRLGARRRDVDSQYLLVGFARCGVCGGGIGVLSGSHRGGLRHLYGCTSYSKRGTSVCGNRLRLAMDRVNDAVLRTLAGDVLRPEVVMAVVDGVLDSLQPANLTRERERLRHEFGQAERQVANLAKAIAAGGPMESLLDELRRAERTRAELAGSIDRYGGALRVDRQALERAIRQRICSWRELLQRQVPSARQLLREVLTGPLRLTPVGRTYRFEGEASIGGLLAGTVDVATFLVAVRGFEPRSRG